MLDTFFMVKEISDIEQRYQAELADGRGVTEVAIQFGVAGRRTFVSLTSCCRS